MNKEFVPYEEALALKELGLSKETLGLSYEMAKLHIYYSNDGKTHINLAWHNGNDFGKWVRSEDFNTFASTYQQAFRWFRENHNILANVYSNASGFLFEFHDSVGGTHRFDSGFDGPNASGCWDTYEEAELASLKRLIEKVKEDESS